MDHAASSSSSSSQSSTHGLSLLFSTFCIVDLFGVFPIVALPRPVIDCGTPMSPSLPACTAFYSLCYITGWVGLPMALFIFLIQVYTAMLLGKCWTIAEHLDAGIVYKNRYPYTALTEMAVGKKAGKLVTFLLDVAVLTAGVPNLMVAAQNLQILGIKTTGGQFEMSFCYWLFILGVVLCPIMWLGSPRDMKWLAVTSVLTVISVSMLTWICMFADDIPNTGQIPQPSWESVAIAYGILAFQFDIHPTVLSVQMDMEKKSQLGVSIVAAFLLTGSLFALTTAIALCKYGDSVRFNLLQGLPGTAPLYLDLLLVTAQIFLSMVIGTSALFQDVEDKLRIPKEFSAGRCFLRSGFVFLIILLGFSIPRFDLIMGLIGGALTGPLMFILPPVLYQRLRQMLTEEKKKKLISTKKEFLSQDSILRTFRDYDTFSHSLQLYKKQLLRKFSTKQMNLDEEPSVRPQVLQTSSSFGKMVSFEDCLQGNPLSLWNQLVCWGIIVMGVSATAAATYYSIKNTILFADFTPSCVMNFTAASTLLDLYL